MAARASTLLASLALACATSVSAADSWPSKPITWIVPFPAGGATDILSRAAAERLSAALNAQVVVENVPGASGAVGLERLKRSAPDGYTVATSPNSMQAVLPYLASSPLPFDTMKDFTPLAGISSFQYVIDVSAASPYKTLDDLIRKAKESPESISLGTTGIGSGSHLGGILLAHMTGVKFNDIRYKGGAPALTDLMGGHIDFVVDPVGGSLGYIASGKLRALAATGSQRIQKLPDVPLVAETIPGYEHMGWFGLYGPANLPAKIVQAYSEAMAKVQKDPKFLEAIGNLAYEPMPASPQELDKRQRAELDNWGKILTQTGLIGNTVTAAQSN
ncbi:tripartite tricarboxylate transporter substrate binding protein [Bordetella sp. BOR01]|uniref:Bug family tripartite tricarboxylate transporter substrate binding protein n=1 Tax=Bordetella sp. BOR01 TaxID=2854779 RepID=UPI001C487C42|nr:tripartite tricarboxylate transporter substrate binding protein [Bordetella sp. BOR01]MBV7486456.1 tripartite tricarboxylate transporter substrate binding protein [Bordetella sp. BOR01]